MAEPPADVPGTFLTVREAYDEHGGLCFGTMDCASRLEATSWRRPSPPWREKGINGDVGFGPHGRLYRN